MRTAPGACTGSPIQENQKLFRINKTANPTHISRPGICCFLAISRLTCQRVVPSLARARIYQRNIPAQLQLRSRVSAPGGSTHSGIKACLAAQRNQCPSSYHTHHTCAFLTMVPAPEAARHLCLHGYFHASNTWLCTFERSPLLSRDVVFYP